MFFLHGTVPKTFVFIFHFKVQFFLIPLGGAQVPVFIAFAAVAEPQDFLVISHFFVILNYPFIAIW